MNWIFFLIIFLGGWAAIYLLMPERARWKPGWYNSGFYHHGAIGRKGEMCSHCARLRWPETDQMFYDKLPEWLKKDPELKVPYGVKRS